MYPRMRRATFGCVAAGALAFTSAAFAASPEDPLAGMEVLRADDFTHAVLERNRSLAAAQRAFEAARARPDQAGALPDPMVEVGLAPLSISDPHAPLGASVELSQRLPFPGKLGLRTRAAEAEARAAAHDYEEARLALTEAARRLYADWFANARAREVNALHRELLSELKRAAEAQYAAGTAPQQDALQAELRLAELEQEAVSLEAEARSLAARINALLQRAPPLPVPPPPADLAPELARALAVVPSDEARRKALESRPALRSLEARAAAADASAELAGKAWLPDFEVMAGYSTMFMDPHRLMVGVGLEIPLQAGRRRAQVAEAAAERARLRDERAWREAEVLSEVEAAASRLAETAHVLALQRDRVLPAARATLESARAGYVTGRNAFQAVIEAERALRNAELRLHVLEADLLRRHASYLRAIGGER